MSYLDSTKIREMCSIVVDRVHTVALDVPQELQDAKNWQKGDVIFYQQSFDNNLVFCQPEFLSTLLSLDIDLSDKVLITHHSDVNILSWKDGVAQLSLGPHIKWEQPNLTVKQWFGRNTCCPEVKAIPCGLYPERYNKSHMFDKLAAQNQHKEHLVYVNFNPNSNPDRVECLKYVNLPNLYDFAVTQKHVEDAEFKFLEDLSKSYFVLSPNGFGVDCHRHWEALQLGAIPIVTDSELVRQLSAYYPFVILPSWSHFNETMFTPELHHQMWSQFNTEMLDVYQFMNSIINSADIQKRNL